MTLDPIHSISISDTSSRLTVTRCPSERLPSRVWRNHWSAAAGILVSLPHICHIEFRKSSKTPLFIEFRHTTQCSTRIDVSKGNSKNHPSKNMELTNRSWWYVSVTNDTLFWDSMWNVQGEIVMHRKMSEREFRGLRHTLNTIVEWGCGSLSLKKMWSLEYFKIWQGD